MKKLPGKGCFLILKGMEKNAPAAERASILTGRKKLWYFLLECNQALEGLTQNQKISHSRNVRIQEILMAALCDEFSRFGCQPVNKISLY